MSQANHKPIDVNDLNFDSEVLASDQPVLLDVSSAWCAPCRAADPVVQRMAQDLAGRVKVAKLDADEAPDIVQRLGIRGVPTFLVFEAGREISRHVGYPGPKGLLSMVPERAASHGPR